MIFRFVAEYSHSSTLRREFAHDPDSVLDRYEIPKAERRHLLAGDRRRVAEQLRAEIDDLVAGQGPSMPMALWITAYPKIVGRSKPRSGPQNQPIAIAISALNLAPDVEAQFHLDELKVDATDLQIDPPGQPGGIYTLHCQAIFPAGGTWGVTVTNVVEGERFSDSDEDYFSVES